MTVSDRTEQIGQYTPGGTFRQYQLLEQIGVGGQAVVWSALDQRQDRVYAIKFNKILESDESLAESMDIEHRLNMLLGLRHERILPILELGSDQRVQFTVSPYIAGGTLMARLRSAPLAVDDVLRMAQQIAAALDYLHSQGVIHRDLKSSNILLDLSQNTYLADFGLARLLSTSTLAFHTGHGTPPYAPPEQIRAGEVTRKSDIFSFGILLHEMFTGQLPWKGQKQLGVEQLHSDIELPDPREYNEGLPALLSDVLRRVTSANPEQRPRSAQEVMKMLFYVFNRRAEPIQLEEPLQEQESGQREAGMLLSQGLSQWESSKGSLDFGLTRFALVDIQYAQTGDARSQQFMMAQALTYGYKDAVWWSAVRDQRARLAVASLLLARENESITARVLHHLAHDSEIRARAKGLPESTTTSLLTIATRTNDAALRRRLFAGIHSLAAQGRTWNSTKLDLSAGKRLGELALEDSPAGDAAAELIGHLRFPAGVRVILDRAEGARKMAALVRIQRAARGLPRFVPVQLRFQLMLDSILHRLVQQPSNLLGAYLMALLGSALGVGTQVYLTYILPDFLDLARLAASIQQGLITGAVLGFGIFLARLISERFHPFPFLWRLLLATLAGGLGINIAFLIFHLLFLNTPPTGSLITLASFGIALAFALGDRVRSRSIRMLLSSSAIAIAIVGTWLLHVLLAASPLEWTPLFRYDYAWPLSQVIGTALVVALFTGTFGNLVRLSLEDAPA